MRSLAWVSSHTMKSTGRQAGAALSIRSVTGVPIKFMGVGEKTDALEPFYPDRLASRILGMGDVLSLIEKAQETIDEEEALRILHREPPEEDLVHEREDGGVRPDAEPERQHDDEREAGAPADSLFQEPREKAGERYGKKRRGHW